MIEEYRGFSIEDDKWIYGSLINNAFFKKGTKEACCYIFDNEMAPDYDCWEDIAEWISYLEVDPKSIGQYIGMKDKNDDKLYKGDIVQYIIAWPEDGNPIMTRKEIIYDDENLCFCLKYSQQLLTCQFSHEFEKVGNVYENPELVKA